MNAGIRDHMLLIRSCGQSSLINCPKSYTQLVRYINQRFELSDNQISYLYYLDDEGDTIRVENNEDLDSMIINNSQTKIICLNILPKVQVGYNENNPNSLSQQNIST